jgi:ubiquitin conjugation factor E4 B
VNNPDRYGFRPKELLGTLADIVVNLSRKEDFIRAVSHDGRAFSRELYQSTAGILRRHGIRSEEAVASLLNIAERVEQMKQSELEEDEMLGEDIPEDFLGAGWEG